MDNSLDLSSVVSMIMKHPELIEEIARLAQNEATEPTEAASASVFPVADEALSRPTRTETTETTAQAQPVSKSDNRKRLFSAIRPFLSDERAKTLSSVEAVVAILDNLHS